MRKKVSRELTEKEIQVLKLVSKGNTNNQIAEWLDRSVRTIEVHRAKILKKLKAKNTAHGMAIVFRRGIIK